MGVYYSLEYQNFETTTSVEYAEAHLATVTVDGETTPHYYRVETRVIVTDDLKNLDDTQEIMDAFVTHSNYTDWDETVYEFSPDGLREAAKEMRESAETASEFDREELTYVAGVLEDALNTYKSEKALYTLRFLG